MARSSVVKLRAASVLAALWAIPWSLFGVGLTVATNLRADIPLDPGNLLGTAIVYAASGGICGFLFSGVIAAVTRAARGRIIPSAVAVATGGAAALAGLALGVGPLGIAAFGVLGVGCAERTMRVAGVKALPPKHDDAVAAT